MNVGIVCYASVGGSGVVATELALALASRGHDVSLISRELPFRWRPGVPGLSFVPVEFPDYPLFREPQYLLALSNALVRVSRERGLDIVHAHYAVPHATAAYLAHQILGGDARAPRPRTVTTLHGTDITLVGSDPSYKQVVAFSIAQSHAVTAVSRSLKEDTRRAFETTRDIQVVPNFLDCAVWRRRPTTRRDALPVIMHVSNFRPVKRVHAVLDVFMRVRAQTAARLVLIGDGPDRSSLQRRVDEEALGDVVEFVGEQHDLVEWLSTADVFLLPSAEESFGLAALEAMACEVPVVASRVGGLPEVIDDGETGFLCGPRNVDEMASRTLQLLRDEALRSRIGRAAATLVREKYCTDRVVPQYEAVYRDVLATAPASVAGALG